MKRVLTNYLFILFILPGILTACGGGGGGNGDGGNPQAGPQPQNPPPDGLWMPALGVTPETGNYIYLESEAGDYIGQGGVYTYTGSNSIISVNTPEGNRIWISVQGDESWSGDFQAMDNLTHLQAGYYGDLQRWPFHNPTEGGLDWGGEGRGCNNLGGWFVVDNVTYSGNTVTAIDLRFEQHCENFTPALRGQIHWSQ